ncbi:Uncharacterised protein [Mycobacterium tuberculosis]|nr:Uncharacterised protein [Mycobacterium tuberculosis]
MEKLLFLTAQLQLLVARKLFLDLLHRLLCLLMKKDLFSFIVGAHVLKL